MLGSENKDGGTDSKAGEQGAATPLALKTRRGAKREGQELEKEVIRCFPGTCTKNADLATL